MALWKKVQNLDEESLKSVYKYYEEHFPIEVRNIFASFIEDEICKKDLDAENVNDLSKIRTFIDSLIEQIESHARVADGEAFYIRQKLRESAKQFKERFGTNQLALFHTIKDCLAMEKSFVTQENLLTKEHDAVLEGLNFIRATVSQNAALLTHLDQFQSEFETDFAQKTQFDTMLQRLAEPSNSGISKEHQSKIEANLRKKKEEVEAKLQENLKNIVLLITNLESKIKGDIEEISNALNVIIYDKLYTWKHQQQQTGNGELETAQGQENVKLEKIQLWCEELADIIWTCRRQIKAIERIKTVNPVFTQRKNQVPIDQVPHLNEKIMSLLTTLLKSTFIVEEQPPQVMKQNTKFPNAVTIRHLVGYKLNAHMIPAPVSVLLIEENMAKRLSDDDTKISDRGTLTNGTRTLEHSKDTHSFSTTYKNCQLKNFRRSDKKGVGSDVCVMEDKFCLYFETNLTVGDQKFRIWTLSLPVVVISHGSQEAQAVATITWDNAFGEILRTPFDVPSKVSWTHLSAVLSQKFASYTGTGKKLSEQNLKFLEKKLFRGASPESVTWTEFCKDPLPGTNFSFWTWFYEAMKLIERYLKEPWRDGHIMGFIERETTEKMLSVCPPATFLARFSDSRLGAISISWIHLDGKVYNINPLDKDDLRTAPFADTIMGLNKIQYLYPETPKFDAFEKYIKHTASGQLKNPYIKMKPDVDVPDIPLTPIPHSPFHFNQDFADSWLQQPSPGGRDTRSPSGQSEFGEFNMIYEQLRMDTATTPPLDTFSDLLLTLPNFGNTNGSLEAPSQGVVVHEINGNGDNTLQFSYNTDFPMAEFSATTQMTHL